MVDPLTKVRNRENGDCRKWAVTSLIVGLFGFNLLLLAEDTLTDHILIKNVWTNHRSSQEKPLNFGWFKKSLTA